MVRPVLTHIVPFPQTDDILPFRNSVLGEYAILMAPQPVGLGLTESEVETIARMGMESRFRSRLP
jgi:adenosine deaminase